jgi:hypothetical protein
VSDIISATLFLPKLPADRRGPQVFCGPQFEKTLTLGVNNRPVGGRNSETFLHPFDMNNNNNSETIFSLTTTTYIPRF